MAESLVFSKKSELCMLCFPPPCRISNELPPSASKCIYAGFVTRTFAGVEDVIKLNWLPVNKNKSLYDETFPEYLNY